MLELKFPIYCRAAEVCPHRQQASSKAICIVQVHFLGYSSICEHTWWRVFIHLKHSIPVKGDPEKKHGFIATFTKGSARLNIMLARSAKSAVYAVSEVSKGEGASQHL